MRSDHEQLLLRYEEIQDDLERFASIVRDELVQRMAAQDIDVQLVSCRVKKADSLRQKLAQPEKTYTALTDVTDLVGVRVVTFFEDSIESVARIIEQCFAVDFHHSADKLRAIDAQKFGYRSLHYVCDASAHPASASIDALRDPNLGEFRFEIQVRTALQHAWAEVEHDLAYKSAIPARIRRRFSRVASLLEIADEEFVSIKHELAHYDEQVHATIASGSSDLPLDEVSLHALLMTDAFLDLDRGTAEVLGKPLASSHYFPAYLTRLIRVAGIGGTDALRDALANFEREVPEIIARYFAFSSSKWGLSSDAIEQVERGYGVFFLIHAVILRGPDLLLSRVARLTRLYQELDGLDEPSAHGIATALLAHIGGDAASLDGATRKGTFSRPAPGDGD